MNLHTTTFLHRAAVYTALTLGSTLLAQTTPAARPAGSQEEVITLSEFNVTASEDRGYIASETLTGSRVRTPIIDLPYTVNVLTSEFFEDFAIFELADNITQIGSFGGLDIGGGFTLRGFGSSSQLRDGFYRLGRYGASNVDRLEIIKGSNAAIYGRTSPGGMVNMISKQPKDREYYRLQLNFGDYGTQRAVLEATGPLFRSAAGKTSYVFTASHYQKDFDQDYARNRNQEYYLAVKHVFADKSSLLLTAEYFLQIRHAPNSAAPIITDLKGTSSNLDDEVLGYAKNLASYNPGGPNSELNRGNIGYNATYEKRLDDVWTVRAAGNYYRARRWGYNTGGWGAITINSTTATANLINTRAAATAKDLIMEDGGGLQADVLAHYWLANHKIENRTLATIDFNDYYRWDPTWNYAPTTNPDIVAWTAAGSGRVVALTPDYRPIAPLTYFPKFFSWGQENLTRLTRRRTTVLGGLLRHQSAFLDGTLLTYVGARFDAVRFQERDFTTAITSFNIFPEYASYQQGQMIPKEITQLKPNLGVNYKLPGNLRVFANYSQSYFVNQTDNPVIFADPTYKPEVADGYDYGFKGAMLNDRLNFTVSGFYATRQNVSVSDTFESPVDSGLFITQNRRDGDQLVRGYEIDLNWRANDELSFIGSWGHVYSIYTNFGSGKPLSIGRRVIGVSPQNGSLSARYAPRTGTLKGFSTNVGWTYVASTPSEAPDAGDTYTIVAGKSVLQRTTYQWRMRIPSFGLWNVGARYALKSSNRYDQTFAINVNNVADRDYLRVSKQPGDRRAVYFTYTLGIAGIRH